MVSMPKRVSNAKVTRVRKTTKQIAKSDRSDGHTMGTRKNKAAVALGKLGGRKGGLTPQESHGRRAHRHRH